MKSFNTSWVATLSVLFVFIKPVPQAFAKENTVSITGQNPVAAKWMDGTITARLTQYHVRPAFQARFRKAMSEYVFNSLKAAGNIMAEAYYEKRDSSILWMIERWSSRKQLDKNGQSNAAKAIIALTKEGLLSPIETVFIIDLEPLSKEAWQKTPKASDQPLTIMLLVDARDGTEDDFKSIYHVAMPQFRSEPGVVTYQLSQVQGEKTKFITYEKFRSEEAFQYHLKFPPIEPVVQYLRTSIKQPPFEKGLHRLVEFAPLHRE